MFKRSKKKGFTLIELIIVIAIIAILAALLVPSLIGTKGKAQVSVNRASVKTITDALEQYYADNDEYPATPTGSDTVNTLFTSGVLKGTFSGKAPQYKGGTDILIKYETVDSTKQNYKLYFRDDPGTPDFDESLVVKATYPAAATGTSITMNKGTTSVDKDATAAGEGYITKDYKYDKLFK